jgi:hypothetical protein
MIHRVNLLGVLPAKTIIGLISFLYVNTCNKFLSNVKGGIKLQEEDTILQYKERSELSIIAPSFHPRIYER